ncbi:restriction endonuclease subunit S [Collinsella sp. CLA-ER-H11]|uniref:restriction endonuclease subunit S n=1 Tax=Collinsella sp. CLA-ER-H11 TaxID=3136219 RepID=UPI0032BF6476
MTRYRFDQIAENSTAKKKPEESDRDRYVGLEHLDPGTLEVTRWGAEVTPKGDKLLMKKGDVLFGRRRAYQKKVGIAPFDGIFSAHGMVLRPKADVVDPMFFPFFISSDIFLDEAIRVSVGSLSPTANWKDLRTLEFDLPSPGKQRELAGILSEAESLKGHYRKMLTTCDDVVKSQFVEMFGGPDPTESDCPTVTIGELAADIRYGTSKKASDSGEFKYLRMNNMTDDGRLDLSDLKYIDLSGAELENAKVVRGDLLFNRTNSREKVGKTCVFNKNEPMVIAGYIVRVRFDERVEPGYVSAFLNSSYGKGLLRKMAKGAVGQANISAKEMAKIELPLPPIELQRSFLDFAASVDKSKFKLGIYGGML